jgi:hypothetical protein
MPVESMKERPERSTVRAASPGSSRTRSSAGSTVNVAFMSKSPDRAARASAPSTVISTGALRKEGDTARSVPRPAPDHACHAACEADGADVLVFSP